MKKMAYKKKRELLLKHYKQSHFSILTPREQKILRSHYGFDEPALTLKQIGATSFDVTGEAIRLIEKRAINKLWKYDFSDNGLARGS